MRAHQPPRSASSRPSTVRSFIASLIILVVTAGCIRLGLWQLSRHAERQARNASLESRAQLAPVDLRDQLVLDSLAYRRASASGVFDWEREIVEYGRSLGGVPGVVLATPLMLASGRAVIVERGWVPSPDAREIDIAAFREAGAATVSGLLIPTESFRPIAGDGWPMETRAIDPEAMASRFPYSLVPLVLRRTDSVDVAGGVMQPFPLPERGLGPHLSYAVQWFLFATIALVGGIGVYVRSRRGVPVEPRSY